MPVPAQRRRGEALACPGLFWNSFEMGNAVRWDTATCGNLRTPSEARSEQKHQAQGRATVDVCSSNGMAAYALTESCTLGNDTKRTHRPHHAPVLRRQARGVELASRCPERRKSRRAGGHRRSNREAVPPQPCVAAGQIGLLSRLPPSRRAERPCGGRTRAVREGRATDLIQTPFANSKYTCFQFLFKFNRTWPSTV